LCGLFAKLVDTVLLVEVEDPVQKTHDSSLAIQGHSQSEANLRFRRSYELGVGEKDGDRSNFSGTFLGGCNPPLKLSGHLGELDISLPGGLLAHNHAG
jgi:hypothetical protein